MTRCPLNRVVSIHPSLSSSLNLEVRIASFRFRQSSTPSLSIKLYIHIRRFPIMNTCSGPQVAAASSWTAVYRGEHVVPAEASRSGSTDSHNGPRGRGSTSTTLVRCVHVAPAPSPPPELPLVHLQSLLPLCLPDDDVLADLKCRVWPIHDRALSSSSLNPRCVS